MDEATWEDEFTLRSQFPSLSLEDKAVFQEGGNDRTHNESWAQRGGPIVSTMQRPIIWRVYTRRARGEEASK